MNYAHRAPGNRMASKVFGPRGKTGPTSETLEKGCAAYEAVRAGAAWADLPVHSAQHARKYALHTGAVWPIERLTPPKLGRKPKPASKPEMVWAGPQGWALR